jgi:heme-degrading monooxygenase HmoA
VLALDPRVVDTKARDIEDQATRRPLAAVIPSSSSSGKHFDPRRSLEDPLAKHGHRAGVWVWSILRHAVPVILEHALLPVKPGQEASFESAFAEAKAIIAGMPGFLRLMLSRCRERPNTYLLLVEWDRLVDHTEGFRGSSQYQEWRRLLHGFYEPFPVVEHYEQVDSA